MRMRALIGATLLAWVALPALALVALADEDPPLRPVDAGPPLRPPLTALRAVERAPSASAGPNASKKELIVLVGGYASEQEQQVFGTFRDRIAAAGGYDVVEFGRDVGTYDTFGPIDASALQLRDTIRALSTSYGGVHIVTHSMGGNVADRAFDLGLSSDDGVISYVAWAAPHDGVHAAAEAQSWLAASGPAREDTRAFAKAFLRDPDTAAVHDMARLRASAPPPGVVRLDLRLATDGLVSSADARDPGVPSRVLLPRSAAEIEGHGGILESEQAFELTLATIRSRAVPPDERGVVLRAAAEMFSQTTDDHAQVVLDAVCVICLIGGIGGLFRRTLRRALPWPPISE